ncbi:MAG TPA: hypothetical protein VIJ81_06245 [Sphingomicrobium sp.]|jgi:hypothetical protein|nr:hypothetical protein [Sphingomicrobium sp.]
MEGGYPSNWLSDLSIVAIGIGVLAVMLIAAGAGRLIRKVQERRSPNKVRESGESVAQEGYLLASMLGLLGLLLAFSFGMVLNRYEARRELVTSEANAIGTAYLRAQLLDEPHRSRLSQLLFAYTSNRIDLANGGGDSRALLARNDQLLIDLWTAIRASRESALAHGVTTALLMSYNEVIDLDTERKVAWDLRVPVEVGVLLIAYLAVMAAVVGHQVDGPRGRRAATVFFITVALSITVMADLNRPMSGHARESQKAMLMLLQSLRAQPPQMFDRFNAGPKEPSGREAGR